MATVTICSDFGAQGKKISHCFHFPPSICHEVMGQDAMILVFYFLVLSQLFNFPLSPSPRSSLVPLLSAIRVVSSVHLKLLISVPAILIPVESSSLGFHVMNSACKLNKQSENIVLYFFLSFEPVNYSMSGSKCCFLTYIQVSQETGKVVWYSHLFKNFPQFAVIHTVKEFSIVNEAEVDDFGMGFFFFYDPMDIGNLISSSSAFSKSSLNIWKFMVLVLLKPGLESFEHFLA